MASTQTVIESGPPLVAAVRRSLEDRERPILVIGLSILLEASAKLRGERLADREGPGFLDRWHERWDAAEGYYFTHVRPRTSFDLIVRND